MNRRRSNEMPLTRFLVVFFGLVKLSTVAWNCDSDFGDVASRTVRSAAVFEGRATRRLLSHHHRGGEGEGGREGKIVFRIERVLKWNRQILSSRSISSTVAVGNFKDPEDPSNCVASLAAVSIGASYVVFIGNGTNGRPTPSTTLPSPSGAETSLLSGSRRGQKQRRLQYSLSSSSKKKEESVIPAFAISGRPEPSSPGIVETVLQYNCSKCSE